MVNMEEVSQDRPKLCPMSRGAAQEIQLAAVLCPLFVTDLSAEYIPRVYSTDASDRKGAVVSRPMDLRLVRTLWKTGRKKASYTRMLTRSEAIVRKLDWDREEDSFGGEWPAAEPDRPRAFRFHFIEICGGAGKISDRVAARGWVVGPVLDLERSPEYDLENLRVLSWIFHMVEKGWLDSFMVEPPCTTFSPAQYPASRSYEEPRGFDPLEPKTLKGTTLALRALALMKLASFTSTPAGLEQPRRSKMRRLSEWQFFHGLAEEVWTASCMFGSPHKKEFVFLLTNLPPGGIHRKCSGDHSHIQIAGAYAKPSATYTDELAETVATAFDKALSSKLRIAAHDPLELKGLESPMVNDVLLSGKWKVEKVWKWKVPQHISIQEVLSANALLKEIAIKKPKSRLVVAMDSNVGLSSLVKGRSPSHGLRRALRRAGATVIAGCLYPAFQFGPTRLLPADHPTRDTCFPESCKSVLEKEHDEDILRGLASVVGLRRVQSNWVRFFLLIAPHWSTWWTVNDSWHYAHLSYKAYPGLRSQVRRGVGAGSRIFDGNVGCPGEGPPGLGFTMSALWSPLCGVFWISWTSWISWFSWISWTLKSGLAQVRTLPSGRRFTPLSFRLLSGGSPKVVFFLLLIWTPMFSVAGAVSHGPRLVPRDARDRSRAQLRSGLELPAGRPVLGKTQENRDKLLGMFDEWLGLQGLSLNSLLGPGTPDIELINLTLEKYGRELHRAGRPYGHYAETVNGVAAKRPRIRRSLQPAWDIAYGWLLTSPCASMAGASVLAVDVPELGMDKGGWSHCRQPISHWRGAWCG